MEMFQTRYHTIRITGYYFSIIINGTYNEYIEDINVRHQTLYLLNSNDVNTTI